jgi:hypothetical protein
VAAREAPPVRVPTLPPAPLTREDDADPDASRQGEADPPLGGERAERRLGPAGREVQRRVLDHQTIDGDGPALLAVRENDPAADVVSSGDLEGRHVD